MKEALASEKTSRLDSSFAKGLSVLDLFHEGRISAHLDDVVAMLGTSKATAYRYLATLCEAGLLAPSRGGLYVLGPRVVELDRLMRISDPFLLAGSKVMHAFSKKHGLNMLLANYYRGSIMCVDIAWPDPSIPPHFERGLPMSLFRGAMAKVILANLSAYQLRTVALHHADDIRDAGMGKNWTEFRSHMTELAKQGFSVTHAEMYPGSVGLSAPIFDPDGNVLGSITCAVTEENWERTDTERLTQLIIEAAKTASQRIKEDGDQPGAKGPARKKAPQARTPSGRAKPHTGRRSS